MRKPKKEIQLTSYDELLGINEAEQNTLKQTEQRDAYIDGLAFGIRTISEAFLHENKNRIW